MKVILSFFILFVFVLECIQLDAAENLNVNETQDICSEIKSSELKKRDTEAYKVENNRENQTEDGLFFEKINFESVTQIAHEVQKTYYPELNLFNFEVKLHEANAKKETSAAYFFWTSIDAKTFLKSPLKRKYQLIVHSDLFRDPPSETAIQGILVHEFQHVLDYVERKFPRLTLFFLNQFVLSSGYERKTDLKAFEKGAAPGILRYRCWLKEKLSPKDYKKKIEIYYSPEEISEWMKKNESV